MAIFAGSLLLSFERIQRQHGFDLTLSRLSLWSVSQADIGLQRLLRAVDGFALGHVDHDTLLKRFEVFRTRLPALAREGEPAVVPSGPADTPVPDLIERLDALETVALGLDPSDRTGLAILRDGLAAFEPPLGRLSIAAHGHLDEQLVTAARQQGRYTWPMLQLLGVLVSGGVLVALLLREARRARRAQAGAREAWAQLRAVIDAVPAMIGVADRDQRYRLMNRFQARFYRLDDGAAVGRRVSEFGGDGDDAERLNRRVVATRRPIPFREEARRDHHGHERTWLTTRVPVFDAAGEVARVVSVSLDITERKRAEAHIAYLAHHDPLTGLPNRLLFNDRLAQALSRSRRAGGAVALHCVDLDRFKQVNDTLGHAAGDAALRAAAERMRGCLRETDTLARLGGDEFAVIQPDLQDEQGAAALAERLVEALHRPLAIDGRHAVVGASVGVALHPRDGTDARRLLRSADLALYEAKARGRDRFRLFGAELGPAASVTGGASLTDDLRRAISGHGEFEVEYQPELAPPGRRPVGVDVRPC
ncbi:MAG TPA: diguanylate cyclase [Geminicoccaceae bacterium]|nr:diguanylate cyclase [Geminicoccaceae bacterium]